MTILSSLSFSSSFRRAATVVALVLFRWVGAADVAQAEDILRGTLVKLDVPGREIVVKRDGRDETYGLDDETRVLSATGRDLAERLKDFRAGDAIFFKPTTRGGRKVLDGIRLVELKGDAKEQGKPGEKPRGDGADRGGAADRRNDGGGRPTPAVVKSIDGERLRIVLKVGERELDLHVTPRTQFRGSRAETQGESLREFKAGDEVFFLAGKDDGRDVLIGLSAMNGGPRPEGANRPDGANRPGGEGRPNPGRPSFDSSALKPLTELGAAEYRGFVGGLYPQGKNERPSAHEAAGLALATQVRPLDRDGAPADDGRIVLLSLGMSNTSQLSDGFRLALQNADGVNSRFQFVNGSQGGMVASVIQNPDDDGRGTQFWRTVDERLRAAGVTRQQVQAVWMKHADAGPNEGFPGYAKKLEGEQLKIVQFVRERFPNVKLTYLSSRTYGGYATTSLNPEPYAYESGFAVKWLIERQLAGDPELNFDPAKGPVKAPWLSWGPYLWANGATPRAGDGFSYERDDFGGDGTHHAQAGQRKCGKLIFDFFNSDSTTKSWFKQSQAKP